MKILVLLPLLTLSLSSCKDSSTEAPILDDSSPKTEQSSPSAPAEEIDTSSDTVRSLALEFVEAMKPMPEVMDSAEDVASAEAAVVEINKIKDAIISVGKRARKLEAPSNEERTVLHEEMTKLTEANARELTRVILENHAKFKNNQEILVILNDGLAEFQKGMEEITPVLVSHFSPDPNSEPEKSEEIEESSEEPASE